MHLLGLEGNLVLAEGSPVGRTAVEDRRSPFHSGSYLHIGVADHTVADAVHTVADAVHMEVDGLGLGRTGFRDRSRLGRVAVGAEEDIVDSLGHRLRSKTGSNLVAAADLRNLAVGSLDCSLDCSSDRIRRIGHLEGRSRLGLDIRTCLDVPEAGS